MSDRRSPKGTRPDTAPRTELPVVSFVDWDRVQQIRQILVTLEQGQFYNASLLGDAMMRDDRVHGTMATRLNGLLGTPVDFEPARDTALCRKIADVTRRYWPRMFPTANSAELHRWGLLVSLGVGELQWRDVDDLWVPRMRPWHPSACQWDWYRHGYWLNTAEGRLFLPKTDEETHGDGRWVIYTPYGFRGFLRGLVRALSMPYLLRMWAYRDWARYNEVHGLPIKKLKVPQDAVETDKDRFFAQASNLGNESVLELPFSEAGSAFDIDLLEAKADSSLGFKDLLEKVEASIGALILGHAQSSSGAGGNVYGSKAASEIRADFLEFDASTLAGTYYDQVLYWFTEYNFGDGALAAKPVYQTTPPLSDLQAGQALLTVGQALSQIAQSGAPIDVRKLLDKFGYPLLDEGAPPQLAKPAPPTPPHAAPPPPSTK